MSPFPFLAALAIVATPVAAMPDPDEAGIYLRYSTIGAWNVLVEMAGTGNCILMAGFRSGTTMRFGVRRRPTEAYLVVSNPTWAVRPDSDQTLDIRFGGRDSFRAVARSGIRGGPPAYTIRIPDRSFARAFATQPSMTIVRNGRIIAKLELAETMRALRETHRCQQEVDVLNEALDREENGSTAGSRDAIA